MRVRNNNVEIEYEVFGAAGIETVILINGTGSQMTRWPSEFCERLVSHGLRTIRLDNRDTGLSTWMTDGDPYSLADMAGDVIAVLDADGVGKAHIAGISMGGMIAQVLAHEYPARVLSLTSMMSNTGDPDMPPPPAINVLTGTAPDPEEDLEAFLQHTVRNAELISSPGFPWPSGALLERARSEYERGYNPAGVRRQLRAISVTGDRREMLRQLRVPTVVLHGSDDVLAVPKGGLDTAALIAGTEMMMIDGMGHDMPPTLHAVFVDAIMRAITLARRADLSRPASA